MQPSSDFLRKRFAGRSLGCAGFLEGVRRFQHAHNQNASSQEFEKLPAINVEVVRSCGIELVSFRFRRNLKVYLAVHRLDSVKLEDCYSPCAAFRMAATIRGCVPQRQMLPSMECAISASGGLEFPFKSATAVMIIPDVQ